MNTNQPMTGSGREPNESVAASWLPASSDDGQFVADGSFQGEFDGAYEPRRAERRFRPALAAALLALGLSAGLAGSAWAHQGSGASVASNLSSSSNTASAASVLPANLAGGDDSDAEDGPALPAQASTTGSSASLTTGGLAGGSAATNTAG